MPCQIQCLGGARRHSKTSITQSKNPGIWTDLRNVVSSSFSLQKQPVMLWTEKLMTYRYSILCINLHLERNVVMLQIMVCPRNHCREQRCNLLRPGGPGLFLTWRPERAWACFNCIAEIICSILFSKNDEHC